MSSEDNGNVVGVGLPLKPTSSSTEDLSEYTDADESMSAPTEILAEFLSAVMLKDYETALKYCKMILQYEPNNATAKEFYPLIIEKLKQLTIKSDNNGHNNSNSNSNESEEDEESSVSSASSESPDSSDTEESSEDQEDEEVEEAAAINKGASGDKKSSKGSDGDATTGSYSSLEDDDVGDTNVVTPDFKTPVGNADDNGNGNTLYSLPNLASNTAFQNKLTNSNGLPGFPFGTSSDSESPTEPITQQTVALLRAKVVQN